MDLIAKLIYFRNLSYRTRMDSLMENHLCGLKIVCVHQLAISSRKDD